MRGGKLRHRLEIRQPVVVNTDGAESTTWPSTAKRGTRWANRRALSGREAALAQQMQADVNYAFEFRSDTVTRAMLAKDRLYDVNGTDWYEVVAPFDPDGRKRSIIVLTAQRAV